MRFYNRSANRKAHFHSLDFAGKSGSKMRALSLVSPALERSMVTITWLAAASDLMSPSGSLAFFLSLDGSPQWSWGCREEFAP
jgi:hypothetical protein